MVANSVAALSVLQSTKNSTTNETSASGAALSIQQLLKAYDITVNMLNWSGFFLEK